jgi:alcohol dehydrogenase, propanol-preferring
MLQFAWESLPKHLSRPINPSGEGGTLVFVALPADNHLQLPIFETVVNGITIKGSFIGNRVDLAETFEMHAAGKTRAERETRKLEDVNEAFDEVDSGKVKARLVFDLR